MENKYTVIKEYFETVRYDGKVIRGMYFRPDADDTRFPTVIFSHGFSGDYSDLIHHGEDYATSGIAIVFFDFCGGGFTSTSEGSMGEMTVLTEVSDLEAVIDRVREFPFVDPGCLYLQGESQGGLVSAIVVSKRAADIKGLILWYPAFIIPEDAKKRRKAGEHIAFGYMLPEEFDKAAMTIDVKRIQKAYDGPVLIIHGDKDTIVPLSYSTDAVKMYQDVTLKVIPGAGHGFDGEDSISARSMSIGFIKGLEH